jgi:hypothetical protein
MTGRRKVAVRRKVARASLLLALAWAGLGPSTAAAQGSTPYPENQPFANASGAAASTRRPGQGLDLRASLFAGALFAGRERRSTDALSADDRLAPGFTLGGRLELATSRYFALGVFVDYARTAYVLSLPEPNGDVSTRTDLFDLGVWMKLRVPVVIAGADVGFYVGLPFGLSILRPTRVVGDEPLHGVMLGAVAGAHVALGDHLGVFAEAGLHVSLFGQTDDLREYQRTTLLQGALRAGASYSF